MKKKLTIIGLALVLLAANACHNMRHERRDIRESGKMIRMRIDHNLMRYREMFGMHHGMMRQGIGNGMMRTMGPRIGFGMMRGMGHMPMDSTGWMPMAPGRRMLESIPNVTENQKKQIEDISHKNMESIQKLREEMFSKVQAIRDSQRQEVLNILTDEQKKFLESGRGKPSVSQEKAK
jgi:hypothetical protein